MDIESKLDILLPVGTDSREKITEGKSVRIIKQLSSGFRDQLRRTGYSFTYNDGQDNFSILFGLNDTKMNLNHPYTIQCAEKNGKNMEAKDAEEKIVEAMQFIESN